MLFNSPEFLFLFLPTVFTFYMVIPVLCRTSFSRANSQDLQIKFLFLASLLFYGYWRWQYLPLLLLSIGTNYGLSVWMAGHPRQRTRKFILMAGIAFNLGLLAYFKYANFFISNIQHLITTNYNFDAIILPIGISFFTFQQIAYLVDRYRQQVGVGSLWRYGLFVTFFPQLIAGPIVHHAQMMPQFDKPFEKDVWRNLALGSTIFIIGLFKKIAIADSIAQLASPVFVAVQQGLDPTFITAWLGAIGYTMQIYFDFSGYSDMAIGLGLLFGIRLPSNFNSPYKASSIIDFWQRWHMTLSRFLRDYLYIPLGGNRRGLRRKMINVLLTMALGGLWHGAAWNFVLWGILHGLYIVFNNFWRKTAFVRIPSALGWAFTFIAVVIAWVPFRAADFDTTIRLYQGMVGLNGVSLPTFALPILQVLGEGVAQSFSYNGLGPINLWIATITLPMAIIVSLMMPNSLEWTRVQSTDTVSRLYWRPSAMTASYIALLLSIVLLKFNDVSEFLYFQF